MMNDLLKSLIEKSGITFDKTLDEIDVCVLLPSDLETLSTLIIEHTMSNLSSYSNIIGMSVSVDVSTSDIDAGHRYFGTVTDVMEDRNSKHGVVLLVGDAATNFDNDRKSNERMD